MSIVCLCMDLCFLYGCFQARDLRVIFMLSNDETKDETTTTVAQTLHTHSL